MTFPSRVRPPNTGVRPAAAECLELQPILRARLPEVASFLYRWRIDHASPATVAVRMPPAAESALNIERRLRWLLVENPVAREQTSLGCCVLDRTGAIRGINLYFPSAFLAGERRMLGLGSGSFFVEDSARSMGFYLFKKYLASSGYSFHFATTCNSNSEPLWRMLDGEAVPNSETEYIFPFRLDVMIPAFVGTRMSSETASSIARMAGRWANPVLRILTRRMAALTIEPCQDWEKLSTLFHRSRAGGAVVTDRSPEFLQWRYGPASPAYPCGIHVFRDRQGNEGWFSLGTLVHGDVQGPFLLDVVWPREKMNFKDIFQEILRVASGDGDAFFFRRQPGLDYREYCPWAVQHRLDARAFVIRPKGSAPLPLDSLDYDDNDSIAWRFHWPDAEAIASPVPAEATYTVFRHGVQ